VACGDIDRDDGVTFTVRLERLNRSIEPWWLGLKMSESAGVACADHIERRVFADVNGDGSLDCS
jgi:hypothetical protein